MEEWAKEAQKIHQENLKKSYSLQAKANHRLEDKSKVILALFRTTNLKQELVPMFKRREKKFQRKLKKSQQKKDFHW